VRPVVARQLQIWRAQAVAPHTPARIAHGAFAVFAVERCCLQWRLFARVWWLQQYAYATKAGYGGIGDERQIRHPPGTAYRITG
jgi:hypothetical protein